MKKPEHEVKNFIWDWCFWCRNPIVLCPTCSINSCACGCTDYSQCPEEEWWDAQNGEEWDKAFRAHFMEGPGEERLVKFLNNHLHLKEYDGCYTGFLKCMLDALEFAPGYGIKYELRIINGNEYVLKLFGTHEAKDIREFLLNN